MENHNQRYGEMQYIPLSFSVNLHVNLRDILRHCSLGAYLLVACLLGWRIKAITALHTSVPSSMFTLHVNMPQGIRTEFLVTLWIGIHSGIFVSLYMVLESFI